VVGLGHRPGPLGPVEVEDVLELERGPILLLRVVVLVENLPEAV
jgi:hypothetical protein